MRIPATLTLILAAASIATASEPETLARLKSIFEAEEEKALAPLVERYLEALDRAKVDVMREGDLAAALAIETERARVQSEYLGEEPEPIVEDVEPAEGIRPIAFLKANQETTQVLEGLKATKKFSEVRVHALIEGGPSKGVVMMERPDGSEVVAYEWTGREGEFRRKAREIADIEDDVPALKIDVAEHVLPDPGPYRFTFRATSGPGRFALYGVSVDVLDQ